MNENKEHSILQAVDRQSKAFFSGGTFHWKKSELEAWDELEVRIGRQSRTRTIDLKVLAFAASFLILLGLGSFLRFYSNTITTPAGEHQLVELPDGSIVELNAKSTLNYYPYWWHFKRILNLEGEAFFKVEKGKKFAVISSGGKTQVLGTTFNIYSRDEHYKVTCFTGRVRVTSNKKKEVILKPDSQAEILEDGEISVSQNIQSDSEISWRKNIFLFSSTPASQVFREIERQYGVTIETEIGGDALYTGNFSKEQNVEDVLGYICPALGLKYVKKTSEMYFITRENE